MPGASSTKHPNRFRDSALLYAGRKVRVNLFAAGQPANLDGELADFS